jgi:hypothetical protein
MTISKIESNQLKSTETIRQNIENDYILDDFVEVIWPITIILIVFIFYFPIRKLIESLANNLGKAREVTIGGVSWKTIDLENAVVDLEILKATVITAYIDEDIDPIEIEIILQKVRNMPSYIKHISNEAKEKILIESINMAGADKKIDSEEYILFRSQAKMLNVEFNRIDDLLLDICITRKITPPPQLEKLYELKKKEYAAR